MFNFFASRKRGRRKFWLPVLFFVFVSLALAFVWQARKDGAGTVLAGPSDNITGFAWSENFGWISFNSVNTGDPIDYGVAIDDVNLNFSDYAWSEHLGWISFDENDPPNFDFSIYCTNPTACDDAGDNCSACFNFNDNEVYGWARVCALASDPANCSGGGDGRISLNADNCGNDGVIYSGGSAGCPPGGTTFRDYGVSIDYNGGAGTGDFSGWAWDGSDTDPASGLGWISFNCATDGSCASFDYRVHVGVESLNRRPRVESMTAPNWGFNDACDNGALEARLGFEYRDADDAMANNDPLSAYRLRILDADNGDNLVFDSGKCNGVCVDYCLGQPGEGQCNPACVGIHDGDACTHAVGDYGNYITHNNHYKWEITVWDSLGATSTPAPYNSPADTDNDDGQADTFQTYAHEFPDPDAFVWFPHEPSEGEEVMFISTTSAVCYESGAPTTPATCGSGSEWHWESPDDDSGFNPNDSYDASSSVTSFATRGQKTVDLRVTDPQGYYCATSTSGVMTNVKLPTWIETK